MDNDLNMIIETDSMTVLDAVALTVFAGLACYGAYHVGKKIGTSIGEGKARLMEAAAKKADANKA